MTKEIAEMWADILGITFYVATWGASDYCVTNGVDSLHTPRACFIEAQDRYSEHGL